MNAPDVAASQPADPLLANPLSQCVRTQTGPPVTKLGNGATPVQICGNNPQRLALIVQVESLDPLFLSPFPSAPSALPLAGADTRVPLVIHAAVYPGLVQGEWWACTTAGKNIFVYETTLER